MLLVMGTIRKHLALSVGDTVGQFTEAQLADTDGNPAWAAIVQVDDADVLIRLDGSAPVTGPASEGLRLSPGDVFRVTGSGNLLNLRHLAAAAATPARLQVMLEYQP